MKFRILSSLVLAACLLGLNLGAVTAQPEQPRAASSFPPAFMGQYQYGIVQAPSNNTHVSPASYISGVFNPFFGDPYFAYYDATSHTLREAWYAGPGKGGCGVTASDWRCIGIDDGGGTNDVGKNNSIATFGTWLTFPKGWGISYYDQTASAVKLAEYRCVSNGNCAWTTETVLRPNLALGGAYGTALQYDSQGVPYILYSITSVSDFIFLSHRLPDGKWQNDTLMQSNTVQKTDVGYYPSLAIHNDKLYAAFYDKGNDALWYATNSYVGPATCTNTTLTGWTCMLIDYKIGMWPSIEVSSTGVPQIASYDKTDGTVNYAIYNGSATPNCGLNNEPKNTWRCDPIEPIGANLTQVSISLALDGQDRPGIAYMLPQDQGPAGLRLARPQSAFNFYKPYNAIGCGPLGSLALPTWFCQTIDGGNGNNDEAGAVALILQPNGLAIMGYSEDDSYYDLTRVKAAFQSLSLFLPLIRQ